MPTNFPAELPPPPIGHQRTNQPKTGRPNQNQQRRWSSFISASLASSPPTSNSLNSKRSSSAITRREDDPEHLEANLDNEEMGGICALLLNRSFGCSETSQDSSLTGYTTLPHLTSFITQVLYTTGFTNIWALDAIRVLKFMKRKVPQTAGYGLSGHRLFLAAFILVVKDKELGGGEGVRIVETPDGESKMKVEGEEDGMYGKRVEVEGKGKEKKAKLKGREKESAKDMERDDKGKCSGKAMKDLWWSAISGFTLKDVREMQAQLLYHLVQ